tara:strand:- start:2608 stop:2799 length:192 start_codon:yes stop_codon:yes gene_type:complete
VFVVNSTSSEPHDHPSGTSRDIAKLPQKAHHPRFSRIPLGLKLDQLFVSANFGAPFSIDASAA